MPKKLTPYIFLIILGFVLIFILGIRYGQKVEKTNKTVNFFLSLPPTKPPEPTKKPLTFEKYEFKECNISFLYPNNLKIDSSSPVKTTFSVVVNFIEESHNAITISCLKQKNFESTDDFLRLKTATESFIFKSEKIKKRGEKFYFFTLNHQKINDIIYVRIDTRYLPLFEKSLEFSK